MPLGVREGVQHPAVLAGRGELQLVVVGQVEHHRPVWADLPVQQHFPEGMERQSAPPIWLGGNSPVMKQVIERLHAWKSGTTPP